MLDALKRAGDPLVQTVREFLGDGCPQMAAALSYYTVFSLPPLLILLMWLVGYVVEPSTVQELLSGQVGDLMGTQGADQVEELISNSQLPKLGSGIGIFSIIAFLFGATGSFAQLQIALNRAWGVAPDPTRGDIRNFLLKRVISFAMILAVGFLLLVSLVISAAISAFGSLLNALLTDGAGEALFRSLDIGISLTLVTLIFSAMFKYIPDANVRWRHALVGGLFTSLLFTAGKSGIGYWLGQNDPGSAFGAAGSLAIALLWIYYTAVILLMGAEFTEVWARRRGDPIVPESGAARVIQTQERFVGSGAISGAIALLVGALALCIPAELRAQALLDEPDPRVEAIEFEGTSALRPSDLRQVIITEARSCKNIFFTPLCWVSNAGVFENQPRLDPEELPRDELRIRISYWRAGYRQATVSSRTVPAGDGVDVIFSIAEGPPTLVSSVDVVQERSVLSQGDLNAAELPPEGRPLDIVALDSAKLRLASSLFREGYADATVRDTIRLSPDGLSAAVEITLEPNARTTIEGVSVEGSQNVSDRTVRRLVDLPEGAVFRQQDLSGAQRRLYRSELFRQAIVAIPEGQDSSKQVVVTVREAPLRSVQLGLGFTTTDFAQGQAQFTRYNWMGGARRVDLNVAVGNLLAPQLYDRSVFGSALPRGVTDDIADNYLRPTWQLSAEVSQPWLFSTRNSLSLGVFGRRRSVLGIVVDQGYGATATITREVAEAASVSLDYRFERTRVEAGDLYFCVNFGVCRNSVVAALQGSQNLSPLRVTALVERVDDPLEPRRGWTGSLEAEHASTPTGSDFHFSRATAETARYHRLGSGVLAGRVRFGWVRGSGGSVDLVGTEELGRTLVHPRKRLYAGGSTSVRGFGENLLGPRILTIDPQHLIDPDDPDRGTPCTPTDIVAGTCDPNVAASEDFLPRPLGGSSVVAASIEYRHPLTASITGAIFVDAARVGDAGLNIPSGAASAITPGFGIRYRSPVGPIRVDLGIRPDISESLPVVTQFVDEDGELRLVQLQTLKDYDPVESTGSFFRKALNRLQLHLSIGEAF